MKKNNLLSFLLLLVGLCIISLGHTSKDQKRETRELQNSLEDMNEWIIYDIEEGRIDSSIGVTYLNTIQQLIN